MRFLCKILLLSVVFTTPLIAFAQERQDNSLFSNTSLWYTSPASMEEWQEYSLPIGNGQLGASLYGGVEKDAITFVEKTLWKRKNVRDYGSYQYFGEIYAKSLDSNINESSISNYIRFLDLENAISGVQYTDSKGNIHKYEYLASHPENVIAVRYSCSGEVNRIFALVSGKPCNVESPTRYKKDEAYFSGKMDFLSFYAKMKVHAKGGKIKTTRNGIEVRGAKEVIILLSAGTDYSALTENYKSNTDSFHKKLEQNIKNAEKKSWNDLVLEHTQDYKRFFSACKLDLGGKSSLDTKNLIDNYKGQGSISDLMLEQLYFAYGRYLCICSNRGVALPNNLQGIWANCQDSPWNSDIHTNINIQMNYWLAEITNLSEMHLPFLQYIINESDTNIHKGWKEMARKQGQERGWTIYTESDIFGHSSTFANNYVIANAWYCTHLWQHYKYTMDTSFLKKSFPAMYLCTQFWLDRLIKDKDGKYVAPLEWSPEHGPKQENGVAHAQQLVRELFDNTIASVHILNAIENGLISKEDWQDLLEHRNNLALGLHIETYTDEGNGGEEYLTYGSPILKEWKYSPFFMGEKHHRHNSHLMCLYPFSQLNEDTEENTSSELYAAALNSLKQRGDVSTGWSMGWRINLWARAHDGEQAHTILKNALQHCETGENYHRGGIYYNLWDAHPPFQIDGNFGVTAGIAEMLLQSHNETIEILPALPKLWTKGEIKGLKAIGNYTIDIKWEDNKATKVVVQNAKGRKPKISGNINSNTQIIYLD